MRTRTKVLAAVSTFVIAGSTLAVAAQTASAALPTITANAGHVSCPIVGKAKINPKLLDNWLQSQHQSPNTGNAAEDAAIKAVPDTFFAADQPPAVTTTAKAKSSGPCTSSGVTDGTHSTTVIGVKTVAVNAGTTTGLHSATCAGVTSPTGTFTSVVSWKTAPHMPKLNPTTVTASISLLTDSHGVGFSLITMSSTGSFAGESGSTHVYVDAATIAEFSRCAPTFKAKLKKTGWVITPKKGKGFNKIGFGPTADLTQSTLNVGP
jgi:hypothetical protein